MTFDDLFRLLSSTANSSLIMQSENFDFPPAATPAGGGILPTLVPLNPPPRRTSDVSARLQHLRNLLNSDRQRNFEQRRAMEALDREMLELSAEPISARLDRRRRGLESQVREYESQTVETTPEVLNNPPALMRARRRATRPSERLQRHRDRLNQTVLPRPENELSRVPLTYSPVPRIGSPDITAQEYSGEAQVIRDYRSRAKRRKLDPDHDDGGPQGYKYGHKGQVVSGPLKMEIVSCDGGHYDQSGESSWPSFVLEDDSRVYCTKSDRCNMVLGHIGNMPFSLRKLVIKAPKTGYDAPIQEGMIFVAMDDDNLLSRTANYQIQYSPRRDRHRDRRPAHSQIRLGPSHEYFNSVRSPLRSKDRATFLQDPYYANSSIRHPPENTTITSTTADFSHPSGAAEAPSLVPGFRVTMDFDNASGDDETSATRPAATSSGVDDYTEADVERLLALQDHYIPNYANHTSDENDEEDLPESDSSDNEELLEMLHRRDSNYHRMSAAEQRAANENYMREFREWRRERRRTGEDWWRTSRRDSARNRRTAPSRIELAPPANNLAAAPNGNARTAGTGPVAVITPDTPLNADVLAPHARFFIRRDKSSVSVKFDPPV